MHSEQLLIVGQIVDDSLMPDVTSGIMDMLAPIFIASTVLTIILLGLFISSALRRRKVENAVLDIQKTLNEMNERDKARVKPMTAPINPQHDRDRTIATKPSTSNDLS